jgi:hypothetical protein
MEFMAGEPSAPDIRNIYRRRSERSLELHMVAASGSASESASRKDGRRDRLSRAQLRKIDGALMSSLAPADLMVQQCLHLFKHICGEHTRVSWALELWRHFEARCEDVSFWREVESIAATESQGELAVGAAALLVKMMFRDSGQNVFTRAAIERLPHRVRLWIETFGQRVLFADSPANKLYLILRRELRNEAAGRATVRRLIFPTHLPPPITQSQPGERLQLRLRRYRMEIGFFSMRLQFHVVEGVRYAIELSRWQRRLSETFR